MPAELLLLLIVAFASPSCQVLSSLRMGEALQPSAPASSDTLPSGSTDPPWEPRHASSSRSGNLGFSFHLSSAVVGEHSPQPLLPPGPRGPDP